MSGFAGEPPTPADQTNPPPALESLRRPRYPVPWRNLRRRRQPSVLGLGETPGDYANFNFHQPRDATSARSPWHCVAVRSARQGPFGRLQEHKQPYRCCSYTGGSMDQCRRVLILNNWQNAFEAEWAMAVRLVTKYSFASAARARTRPRHLATGTCDRWAVKVVNKIGRRNGSGDFSTMRRPFGVTYSPRCDRWDRGRGTTHARTLETARFPAWRRLGTGDECWLSRSRPARFRRVRRSDRAAGDRPAQGSRRHGYRP